MTFTPEQIKAIEKIVDCRILMHNPKHQAQATKPYHTVQDIRELIINNEAQLRIQFGDREFDIVLFRYELAKLTTLCEGDLELLTKSNSRSTQDRWARQVLNAIAIRDWPDCPIKPGSKRRSYRFIPQANFSQPQIIQERF